MFPDNKAVQPCLAPQTDTRRAISSDSPVTLTKFADQKKTELSNESSAARADRMPPSAHLLNARRN